MIIIAWYIIESHIFYLALVLECRREPNIILKLYINRIESFIVLVNFLLSDLNTTFALVIVYFTDRTERLFIRTEIKLKWKDG